ncbi:GIY-YIG nuclease family protein [Maribacter ulvicola]|uniref:Putative endonuclease n=1 Tax=Maribacter ulvicola TaxID=228959 RepID=A0A1N6Y536_9FLAO|nr:GIY-YIG nuclease family protein [Maribacter ulvicola]SIR09589.1 putative endonuclease [Maribacter ulvicola]
MSEFMYILECSDGSYYTGSTKYLDKRIVEHQECKVANHTRKRLPVKLVYVEEYLRINSAFYREKQIKGRRREKKEALINSKLEKLPSLGECLNETHYSYFKEK